MKIAVTGADGFLGWHARCLLKARGGDCVAISRSTMADPAQLAAAVAGVDLVLHFAGVNRDAPAVLREQNLELAARLTRAIDYAGGKPHVIYGNSIQSGNGSPFGDGKQAAADHLRSWAIAAGAIVTDVRLPNLFGEHGRPHYNSVVATFCHELAIGHRPVIDEDRELPLLHVQDALDDILARALGADVPELRLQGRPTTVLALVALLDEFHDLYQTGDIPDLSDPFRLALFNTYRSYVFPDLFPIRPSLREDSRGQLFECVRGHGGQAQVFCSTSHPGITRGEHFHRRKVERFMVLSGTAVITLRKLFDDVVIQFDVSGEQRVIVDMPTMWAHAITNTGTGELLTLFWANEVLDPRAPDTYPERVRLLEPAGGARG